MTATEIRLPQSGMGMADGTIIKWHVAPGERVEKGAPLCDIEAAKATIEMEAPVGGAVIELLVAAGENVPVNTPIILIDEGASAGASPVVKVAPEATAVSKTIERPLRSAARAGVPNVQIEPRARRAARQNGVALNDVRGTGPQGRIVEEDVLRHAAMAQSAVSSPAPQASASALIPVSRVAARSWLKARYDIEAFRDLHRGLTKARPGISLQALLLRASALAWQDASEERAGIDVAVLDVTDARGQKIFLTNAESLPLARLSELLSDSLATGSDGKAHFAWLNLDPIGAEEGDSGEIANVDFVLAVSGIEDDAGALCVTLSFNVEPAGMLRAGQFLKAFRFVLKEPMVMLA